MGSRRVEQLAKHEVLSYIIRNGISSRKEIAEKIGVTSATLTHVVSELMENGFIYEMGTLEEGKVGRKQVMLNVHKNIRYVIGFDVGLTSIRVTLLNIQAEILEMRRWNFMELKQEILDEAKLYVRELTEKYDQTKILGIGLLMQGYIKDNLCLSMPIQNIRQQLSSASSLEIYMKNNVKGLAIAEYYFGNSCDNYVIIKYGPGIGAVVVVDGKILEGYSNHAGELGHILWDSEHQKKCIICGKKGCLESIIGFGATIEKANPNKKVEYPSLQALLEASKNDQGAALNEALYILSHAVNMFVDIIDPEKVFLAGEIFKEEAIYRKFLSYFTKNNQHFQKEQICRIVNYSEKNLKAAGVVVLNEFFGKGSRSILVD